MCTWILIIGLIILVGNSTISILLSKKFLLKAHFIVLHYQNCAINKHHSCPVFSASCADFRGQTGTRMLSVSGLVESRRLKWHTPQHEIDTMMNIGIQTDQTCIGVDFSVCWILKSEWGTLMLMRCLHTKQSVVFMGTQKLGCFK